MAFSGNRSSLPTRQNGDLTRPCCSNGPPMNLSPVKICSPTYKQF